MLLKKKWFIIMLVILVVMAILAMCLLIDQNTENNAMENNDEVNIEEYKIYLLTLTPEDVIVEYIKVENQKDIARMKEAFSERRRDIIKDSDLQRDLSNLISIEYLEMSFNEHATTQYIDDLDERMVEYIGAAVFDVTYDVKYKKTVTQDSGVHTSTYWMIKENDKTPWQIYERGFY